MTTDNKPEEMQFVKELLGRDDPHSEWDDLVNSDLPEPQDVLPPGYLGTGEIINRPSEENPAPMKVSDLAFKGYVEVWDTRTGVLSLQPRWLLWQTMTKKREDGSQVFTLVNPQIPPSYGDDLMCPLHPESALYARLKGMGFATCPKRHIPNQAALNSHIEHSHKRTWAFMEQDRQDRIREEDRQLQRDMLEAMTKAAVRGVTRPEYTSETPVILGHEDYSGPVVVDTITVPSRRELFDAACPACTKVFHGKTRKQAGQRLSLHQRACKATP